MFFSQASKGHNQPIYYLATIVVVFMGYAIGQMPLQFIVQEKMESLGKTESEIGAFFKDPNFSSIGISSNLGLLLLLSMFIVAAVLFYIMIRHLHKKDFRTLITPFEKISWGRIGFGFVFWMGLTMVFESIVYGFEWNQYLSTFNSTSFIPLLLISLLILPIQTTFEEVFFRGFLMQGIYNRTKSVVISIIITSLLFGLIHATNPEIWQHGMFVMQLYYISAGLMLALVTVWDNRLELAIGIHAAINIYGAIFVGYQGATIQTDAIFKTTQMNPLIAWISLLLSGILFCLIAGKKYKWKFGLD